VAHRLLRFVALALVALAALVAAPALAAAQETEPSAPEGAGGAGVQGTLNVDDVPVAGVLITVTTIDGAPVGEATSADDGTWFVPVPSPGAYTVTLDETTLPEGINLRAPDRNPASPTVQPGRARNVLFGLVRGTPPAEGEPGSRPSATSPGDASGGGGRSSPSFFDRFVDRAVDGIVFGLILAVAAVGLSLIFGTTKLVNFAHGEMVTFGAVVAWFLSSRGPRLPVLVAAVIAVIAGALLGTLMEGGLWRPLRARRTGTFQLMVISIGLAIVLRQAILIWFGPDPRPFRQFTNQSRLDLGPVDITPRSLVIAVVCLIILVGIGLMLQRTKIGKALRAVSDSPDLSASSGINVERVILFVWALGGGLAAAGGIMQGLATRVEYLMGFQLLLLMFAGVVLGGLGTAYGAMVGSIVVGLATELSTLWIAPELKYVAALLTLIVILLIKPEGLLGRKERVG
jgi:branched-chain amino acid transport system permease protein